MASWGERLTRKSAELTDAKRVVFFFFNSPLQGKTWPAPQVMPHSTSGWLLQVVVVVILVVVVLGVVVVVLVVCRRTVLVTFNIVCSRQSITIFWKSTKQKRKTRLLRKKMWKIKILNDFALKHHCNCNENIWLDIITAASSIKTVCNYETIATTKQNRRAGVPPN